MRGCSRISPGCANCYAERIAARFRGPGKPFEGFVQITNGHPQWTGKVELLEGALDIPRRVRKPTMWFVNSMSDLFHESLRFEEIARVFDAMMFAHHHTYQVLTKRADRLLEFTRWLCCTLDRYRELFPHVWLGVSVEDQQRADERIPLLLQTPAAVRFVSYEPALGPVDFTEIKENLGGESWRTFSALEATDNLGLSVPRPRLDWIIVGGESGPNARPLDVAWVRKTVRDCNEGGVACFVKQLGSHAHRDEDMALHLNDRKGGDMSEWSEDLRVREMPKVFAGPCASERNTKGLTRDIQD